MSGTLTVPVFQPSATFTGRRPASVYKLGPIGIGYYRDTVGVSIAVAWLELADSHGRRYYVNTETQQSSWTLPTDDCSAAPPQTARNNKPGTAPAASCRDDKDTAAPGSANGIAAGGRRAAAVSRAPEPGTFHGLVCTADAQPMANSGSSAASVESLGRAPIPVTAKGRKLGFGLGAAGKSKRQKVKNNIFGASAVEEETEEMPPEAKALMRNLGSQTVKAGCQSSSQGYYYAPRPWDVAQQRPAADSTSSQEVGTTHRRS
jgi:hypothetical protein